MSKLINLVDQHLYRLKCYSDYNRVRNDTTDLIKRYPSLRPSTSIIPNSTTNTLLLYLMGTIPINFRGNQYHIPVNIWLPERYPQSSPVVFITPTSQMKIRNNHRHVDSQGRVYLPFLSSWKSQTHSLIGLVSSMSTLFSNDPPVSSTVRTNSSQPQNYQQQPPPLYQHHQQNPQSYQQQHHQQQKQPQSYQQQLNQSQPYYQQNYSYSYIPPSQDIPSQDIPSQDNPFSPQVPPKPLSEKERVSNKVVSMLHNNLHFFNQETTKKIDNLIQINSDLSNEEKMIEQQLKELSTQQEIADKTLLDLDEKIMNMNHWIEQHQTSIDIDEITMPQEFLKQQLLECVSKDSTFEDVLYILNKALAQSLISLDNYLKQVRNISRKQFFLRASINKIIECQRRTAT